MKSKILTLFLLTFSIANFAQSKKELEIKDFFWGENDKYNNSTEIPDKWKNESAVILYKNQNYDYHNSHNSVDYINSIRKRIKLLDKSAVNEFSQFSFSDIYKTTSKVVMFNKPIGNKSKTETHVGIKIIKPNGKEIEINFEEEAVEVDGEKKIAISNLEVGDIIDYYVYKEKPFKSFFAFGFDPVEKTLSEEYPIVDFKLFFKTELEFFINFNSYNGAPELKSVPNKRKKIQLYSLKASNIDKYDVNRWFFPLVELPSYKFQVFFARPGKKNEKVIKAFLPKERGVVKKEVSLEDIKKHYNTRAFNSLAHSSYTKPINKHFKNKTFKTDTEKVTAAYYYMRHHYFNQFIEDSYAYKADIIKNLTVERDNFIGRKKAVFFTKFRNFLVENNITYEVILTKKRYDGNMDDLLIAKNISQILKVNTETPLYISFYTAHNTINKLSPYLEGTQAYLLTKAKKDAEIDEILNTTTPVTSYLDNETKKNITVNFNDTFSTISLSIKSDYKGHSKTSPQDDLLIFEDYIYDDHKKYGTEPMMNALKTKEANKIVIAKKFNALKEKLKEYQKENMEELAKSEFGLSEITDYKYNIGEKGRYNFNDYFSFNESFTVEDVFIKKAGPNYIFEIGKLIGGQIDISEKERKRTENIHMNYPRVFNYEIKLDIPEGYSIVGLDKLKKTVDNTTGAFISDAKIEGNTLKVTTSKRYKNYYEPNSNWNLMVDFLDAANQFTNEKILLKKL